jgi:hypothetical protein
MNPKEREAVTKNGGKIIIAPLLNGKSSSSLIDKINAEAAKLKKFSEENSTSSGL